MDRLDPCRDILVAAVVAVRVVGAEAGKDADQECHVVFGILFFNGLDLFGDRDVTDAEPVDDAEKGAEAHEVVDGIETAANLKHDVLGALVIDDQVALDVVPEETDELVKDVGVLGTVVELGTKTADLVKEDNAVTDDLTLEKQMLGGELDSHLGFGDADGDTGVKQGAGKLVAGLEDVVDGNLEAFLAEKPSSLLYRHEALAGAESTCEGENGIVGFESVA